jgi:hypothetical protein
MRNYFNVMLMVVLIFTTSCASMFSGTSEKIKVRSDVPGTKLYLNEEEIGTDEATVKIAKKNLKESQLIAKKDGCKPKRVEIQTKFDPFSLLGILVDFGIITIGIVDWGMTGAVFEAERTNYVLNPICSTTK